MDLERYRLDDSQVAELAELAGVRRKQARQAKRASFDPSGGLYIPPIPLEWAQRARACGQYSMDVACVIWFAYRVRREDPVRLTPYLLGILSVDRRAAVRVLKRMAKAGLVEVEFHRGRSPRVTICEVPATTTGGASDE